jgi:hypothetical protein
MCEFSTPRCETFELDAEGLWCGMDRNLFGGIDRLVAPRGCKLVDQQVQLEYSLFAFILVLSFEFLDTCKLS